MATRIAAFSLVDATVWSDNGLGLPTVHNIICKRLEEPFLTATDMFQDAVY